MVFYQSDGGRYQSSALWRLIRNGKVHQPPDRRRLHSACSVDQRSTGRGGHGAA